MTAIDTDAVEHIPPEAASTYAKLTAAYGQAYYRSVAAAVVSEVSSGDRLLDAGTGPGHLPVEIVERDAAVRVDAFDFTGELLQYGRSEARERGVDGRIEFFAADCYAIPVVDEGYDVLTCTGVVHSLERPTRALTEFYRVLEPGGRAWVFDPAIIDLPEEPDLDLTPHEREILEDYGVRAEDEEEPLTEAEAEQFAGASPFERVEIDRGEEGDVRLYLTRLE